MKISMIMLLFVVSLTGCSSAPSPTPGSIAGALQAAGIDAAIENAPSKELAPELEGVSPAVFRLDQDETAAVYAFASSKQQELALISFQKRQALQSSHAPLIFEANRILIVYRSSATAPTVTPDVSSTRYGEALQQAAKRLENL